MLSEDGPHSRVSDEAHGRFDVPLENDEIKAERGGTELAARTRMTDFCFSVTNSRYGMRRSTGG
jgi:hypothetical protein